MFKTFYWLSSVLKLKCQDTFFIEFSFDVLYVFEKPSKKVLCNSMQKQTDFPLQSHEQL